MSDNLMQIKWIQELTSLRIGNTVRERHAEGGCLGVTEESVFSDSAPVDGIDFVGRGGFEKEN